MMQAIELKNINAKITKLGKAEKVGKALLGELSRDLLQYTVLQASWDVGAINRLVAVLSPMNKKVAVLFFSAFTPFSIDKETGLFGAMPKNKDKKEEAKGTALDACLIFLDDEDNNIWSWAENHVKVEKKDIDWGKRVTKDIQNAMDADKGGMSLPDVMAAVLAAGITVEQLTATLGILYAQDAQADAVAVAVAV